MEMRQQHDQRIADAPDLPAIGADIRQYLLLDVGGARLAKIDVDHAQLVSDRAEECGPRIDRLNDISGKRHLECRHAQSPPVSAARSAARKIKASFRFD